MSKRGKYEVWIVGVQNEDECTLTPNDVCAILEGTFHYNKTQAYQVCSILTLQSKCRVFTGKYAYAKIYQNLLNRAGLLTILIKQK